MNSRAFTLFELIIVMMLLVLLSIELLPRLLDSSAYTNALQLRALLENMRIAQKVAIASACNVAVEFDKTHSRFIFWADDSEECSGEFSRRLLIDGRDSFVLPARLHDLQVTKVWFYFDPLGRALDRNKAVIETINFVIAADKRLAIIGATGFIAAVS